MTKTSRRNNKGPTI